MTPLGLALCLSVLRPLCLSALSASPPLYLSASLPLGLFISLSLCLSACLPLCLSVSLSLCLSRRRLVRADTPRPRRHASPARRAGGSATTKRYDDLIRIFGQPFVDQLGSLKYFMVGCGALGCELIKNFALCGVCCGEGGSLVVTDADRIEVGI